MKKSAQNWKWSAKADKIFYSNDEMIKKINPPIQALSSHKPIYDTYYFFFFLICLPGIRFSSVVIWYEILSNVNIVSKILQGVSINFLVAVEHLNKLKETKGAYRTDEYFGLILKEASQLTQSLGIENTFTSEDAFRRRKRKKQFDYENKINPENNFKINSFSLY